MTCNMRCVSRQRIQDGGQRCRGKPWGGTQLGAIYQKPKYFRRQLYFSWGRGRGPLPRPFDPRSHALWIRQRSLHNRTGTAGRMGTEALRRLRHGTDSPHSVSNESSFRARFGSNREARVTLSPRVKQPWGWVLLCGTRIPPEVRTEVRRAGGAARPAGSHRVRTERRSCHAMAMAVFTQKTRRQNFDATPGTDWAVFLPLFTKYSIMLNLKPVHPLFDASVKKSDDALPV